MTPPDTIEIRRLHVTAHIGVPDDERANAQVLWLTVRMVPGQGFDGLADDLAGTIDYQAVAAALQHLAATKPRRLIETLAVETAGFLLANYPLQSVSISIEKHILPDTECVAVHLVRERMPA
jgi:dihydroneopterin aldolase